MGTVLSVNISEEKGKPKRPVDEITLVEGVGVLSDAHAGSSREVSLLNIEDVRSFGKKPGDFAENITFEGIRSSDIKIGSRLRIGREAVLEVTSIGKICHSKCSIYLEMGRCIMPSKGIFAKVLRGGKIKRGDSIEII